MRYGDEFWDAVMAGYIVNHTKKKRQLEKKVAQLRRLMARGADPEKLLEAALEVRDARVSALRARHNEHSRTSDVNRDVRLRMDRRLNELRSITAEAVLAEFLVQERRRHRG
jgi:hypothetical protein